jgi:hypothetical protein
MKDANIVGGGKFMNDRGMRIFDPWEKEMALFFC